MITLGWVLIGCMIGGWLALMVMRFEEARRWYAVFALVLACAAAVVLIALSVR